jgi:hypothetical protein
MTKTRQRKLGRPRTGHDPMVGVRLRAVLVKEIDKRAAAISATRTDIVRLLVEHGLEYGSLEVRVFRSVLISALRGRKSHRGRVTGR